MKQTLMRNRLNTTPSIGTSNQCIEMEEKGDGGLVSSGAALVMAAEVFKRDSSSNCEDSSSELGACRGVNRLNAEESTAKTFLRRKIAAHIKKKAEKERETVQRGMLAKIGEPMQHDFVRINNNLSLQISRHTSRHSRYADDSSTDSDNESVDSFCDEDDLTIAQEVGFGENSHRLS